MNLPMNNKHTYQIPEGTEIIHEEDLADHIHEIIEIPDSVQTIEEGSFAHGKEPMQILFHDNPYFSYQDNFLVENQTEKLIAYLNNQSVIHVPSSLSSVGKWAFYECTPGQIIFQDEIREIHENALTTCRIQEVVFAFCDAHIFFPKKDIRLRQYLLEGFGRNGMFDFNRYDDGISAGYIEPDRIQEMTARLKWPYSLSGENKYCFRKTLQNNLSEILIQLGNTRDFSTLHWLIDLNIINHDNQEDVLKTLHSLHELDAYMDLSRCLNHVKENRFDFSI